MKLSEIFNLLQYGELLNVSISGDIDAPKLIQEEDYPTLISHINLALIDLHTKFDLKEREVIIQQEDEISFYKLSSEFAQSNTESTEEVKYIIDGLANTFKDDVVRINAIYNEWGKELPINDENVCGSVFLSAYNEVQVPFPSKENTLFIHYRAKHQEIPVTHVDTSLEVDLPSYCIEALLAYVASRVHGSKLSGESQTLSVSLRAKYQMLCDQIEERNVLHNTTNNSNIKLGEKGWV